MLIRSLGTLLLAASTSCALKGTSPFLLLSTEPINYDTLHSSQIATASSIEDRLLDALSSCDASRYIFLEQGGIRSDDLRDAAALPQLQQRMSQDQYASVIQVPEIMGNLNTEKIKERVRKICEEERGVSKVSKIWFPVVVDSETAKGRKDMLDETNAVLARELPAELSNYTSHVLIFTSKPASVALAEEEYIASQHVEMDEPPFDEGMHIDLKRDVQHGARRRRQASNGDDLQNGLGLFEKYQFFSPGIFMGLTVSLLLFIILYIGITAIASLEVSYMAFSKEMGPQAQKKQQ